MIYMNELLRQDWVDASAFISTIVVIVGFVGWLSRALIARNFVSHAEHVAAVGRISAVELRMRDVATKEDLGAMERRLAPVETGVAVLRAELQGVKDITLRTEHMLTIIWQSQLDREVAKREEADKQ